MVWLYLLLQITVGLNVMFSASVSDTFAVVLDHSVCFLYWTSQFKATFFLFNVLNIPVMLVPQQPQGIAYMRALLGIKLLTGFT